MQTKKVSVVGVKYLAENIFRIEIDRPAGFNFIPGQFARIGINPTMELRKDLESPNNRIKSRRS